MQKKISTSIIASLLLSTNLYSSQSLETITVTSATKSIQSIKDVTSNIEVITKEEIQERNFTTVAEALNTLPGISYNSTGGLGNTTSVFLRGMDTNRILVLIDGTRYQDPSNTSGASFSHLMISDIERIEVLKGPQSGIWGADASAGVINIITRSSKTGLHATVNTEIGSFNTKKFGASVSNKTKIYDVKLTVNRILSDGHSAQSPKGKDVKDYEKDGYRNTTVNVKAGLNLSDDTRVDVKYNHINAFVEYDSYNNPNGIQRSDTESNLYSIALNKKYENNDVKLKYDSSKFAKKELDATSGVSNLNGETQIIELLDSISYRKKDNLVVGTAYEDYDADYIEVTKATGNKHNINKLIYLTNTNHFDKLTITESLRRDDYSNFGSKVTGKIGAKYEVNKDLYFSSNYGTGYNAPNIIRMLNPWGASNTDIEPEETKGYDITASYKGFAFTYFKNKVDNLVEWEDPTPLNWSNKDGFYKNIKGTSIIKGYEAKYSKSLNDDLLLNLNYTHLDAKDSSGEDLKRRPKRQFGFALDYYGIEKLHLNVNASYLGARYNKGNKTGTQTGKYTLWNSVANYKINKSLSTYLKVDNLLNKKYQTVDGYATAERSAYVGLKATF